MLQKKVVILQRIQVMLMVSSHRAERESGENPEQYPLL
jgi:hypothetical protein